MRVLVSILDRLTVNLQVAVFPQAKVQWEQHRWWIVGSRLNTSSACRTPPSCRRLRAWATRIDTGPTGGSRWRPMYSPRAHRQILGEMLRDRRRRHSQGQDAGRRLALEPWALRVRAMCRPEGASDVAIEVVRPPFLARGTKTICRDERLLFRTVIPLATGDPPPNSGVAFCVSEDVVDDYSWEHNSLRRRRQGVVALVVVDDDGCNCSWRKLRLSGVVGCNRHRPLVFHVARRLSWLVELGCMGDDADDNRLASRRRGRD